ncbi:hypothetical protein HU200_062725 [Digitaria exilis]|uniref:Uncharacterized protein n=1 Tax=Digitaria exilis TaxID=1010633 RepID=A0A835AEY4_9POAL|nr:hypothetical protein HU200_062725 [Digitaria exilis]
MIRETASRQISSAARAQRVATLTGKPKNGVPHQPALNVMVDLYDGRNMWGFTEKDIRNKWHVTRIWEYELEAEVVRANKAKFDEQLCRGVDVQSDRHDGVRMGSEASQEQKRLSKLLPKLMKLGRARSRSDRAFDETDRQLDVIIPGIDMFHRSNRVEQTQPTSETPCGQRSDSIEQTTANTNDSPQYSVLTQEMLLLEPHVSRRKGRDSAKERKNCAPSKSNGNPLSTYSKQNYGNRQCSICGVRGTHYSTTCPLNPDRSTAAEARANKKGSKANVGQARKRGRPRTLVELDQDADDMPTEESDRGAQEITPKRSRRNVERVNYLE